MAISFLEFLYVLTRNSDNISKLSMIPLFSIHDPYISLGCLFRDCAQLALRAMLRVSLDFSSRILIECTMHHAPCTMHLCVFAIQETLANHLYGTLYHNAPCSYLPSRYRKFTFYYDFLWISDHDTKCTMHHAPCTMHLCVFANKETLANELHGTLYVDAPYTYFYLKIDFLL
jgi:hypothetical protein